MTARNTDGELVRRILCGPIGSARTSTLSSGPTTAVETPATHPSPSVAGGFGGVRLASHIPTHTSQVQHNHG